MRMSKRVIVKNHLNKVWRDGHYIENLPFIGTGLIAGVVCCLYAMLFSFVENQSTHLFERYSYIFFIIGPILFPLSLYIVQKFSPGANGSGIPQVITCIEKSHSHLSSKFLGLRVIVVKIISSAIGIFAGGAIGREGPSLQISAAIANSLGKFFKKLNIHVKQEQLLIAGAASGLAAAFNTPIGGIVYAIEELSQDHVRSYKDVLLFSVVIAGITAQLMLGNYLYLGYPQVASYFDFKSIFAIIMTALLSGVFGSLFSVLLVALIKWRKSKSLKTQLFIASGIGLVIATIMYVFGERAVYSGNESINFILFSSGELSVSEMGLRFISPLITSMSGIAGGVFAPALSAGATLGGFISEFIDPSLRSLLGLTGMIGFLTGVTRTPITSFILVLEMTDRRTAVFAMMLAAVFSSLGTYLVGNKSFYEAIVESIKEDNPVEPEASPKI